MRMDGRSAEPGWPLTGQTKTGDFPQRKSFWKIPGRREEEGVYTADDLAERKDPEGYGSGDLRLLEAPLL